jgi:hypothetical protein
MNVTFMDGFDLYNGVTAADGKGLNGRWSFVATPNPTLVAGRFGGQAVQGTDGSGTATNIRAPLPANQTSFCLGFAFNHAAGLASLASTQPIAQLADSAVAAQLGIYVTAAGVLSATRGANSAALITSAAGAIVQGSYGFIEMFGTVDDVTGTLELWLNGVQIGTFAGDTKQTANANVAFVSLLCPDGTGSVQQVKWDDVYATDTAARLGERRIETIRPSADTAQKDWTASTGVNNAAMVDETTVDTSDYVQASTVGNLDLYDLVDLSSTPATIDAIQATMFHLKTDATSRSVAAVADVSGTTSQGADKALASTVGSSQTIYNTKPGGGAWSPTAVNGLKIGPKVTV